MLFFTNSNENIQNINDNSPFYQYYQWKILEIYSNILKLHYHVTFNDHINSSGSNQEKLLLDSNKMIQILKSDD